jgi:hypothetical protein
VRLFLHLFHRFQTDICFLKTFRFFPNNDELLALVAWLVFTQSRADTHTVIIPKPFSSDETVEKDVASEMMSRAGMYDVLLIGALFMFMQSQPKCQLMLEGRMGAHNRIYL